jgi:hypothetical protein
MARWYICDNEAVSGPYDTEIVQQKISVGEFGPLCLIWGQPQDEWKPLNWWSEHLTELLSSQKQPKNDKLWHYVINGVSHGPVKRFDLVQALKDLSDRSDILIWTNGMSDWQPLFDVTDIMDEIGITRRKHPRAKISGQIILKNKEQNFIGSLNSVSAGGCGVTGIKDIPVGSTVQLTLKSENFHKELRAQAEVRYISKTGYMGLMFNAINSEEKAAIIDYVRNQISQTQLAA